MNPNNVLAATPNGQSSQGVQPPSGSGMLSQPLWSAMMSQSQDPTQQALWSAQQTQAAIMLQQAQSMAGFNNMAFVPNPILQDAIRLSTPVGSSPNDDVLLAQVLHDTLKNGFTYKRAIESLHGVNNHSSSLWKDYYLEEKTRIDQLVVNLANGVVKTTKKPTLDSSPPAPTFHVKRRTSSPSRASSSEKRHQSPSTSAASRSKPRHPPKTSTQVHKFPAPFKGGRKTINSLTTHNAVFDAKLPQPHADIPVPPPPSRSPTPPTEIVVGKNGNKYTEADRQYFIKFIAWRLKQDPSLSKAELCELLSEKAPHHTAGSWASHWHAQHDLADKIFAAAKGDDSETESEASSSSRRMEFDTDFLFGHAKSETKRKVQRGTESNSDENSTASEDDSPSDYDFDSENDENEMGEGGSQLTKADFRVMAKHIATSCGWETPATSKIWVSFAEKFPQRSNSSWSLHYRNHKKKIHRLAQNYADTNPRITPQRGRPSWASTDPKRKHSEEEPDPRSSKRTKGDSDEDDNGTNDAEYSDDDEDDEDDDDYGEG